MLIFLHWHSCCYYIQPLSPHKRPRDKSRDIFLHLLGRSFHIVPYPCSNNIGTAADDVFGQKSDLLPRSVGVIVYDKLIYLRKNYGQKLLRESFGELTVFRYLYIIAVFGKNMKDVGEKIGHFGAGRFRV